jgi:serine/threonine-protein kinase
MISIENLSSPNISLAQFTLKQIRILTESPSGYQVIESAPTTIGRDGNLAHKIIYCGTSVFDKHTIKGLEVWTIKQDKAYMITSFTAAEEYSNYLPIIQEMVDSFNIII